ncbi:hypothetical protein Tco_0273820 [Tanacetum coccineum]
MFSSSRQNRGWTREHFKISNTGYLAPGYGKQVKKARIKDYYFQESPKASQIDHFPLPNSFKGFTLHDLKAATRNFRADGFRLKVLVAEKLVGRHLSRDPRKLYQQLANGNIDSIIILMCHNPALFVLTAL